MIKQMRASYFHNFKNAQYCALSDDPIPDDLENGDEVYIIDQGKIYYWDESSSSLYEYKGGGSGGSSSFVPCFGSLATVSLGTTWSGDDPYVSTVTVTGYTVTNQTMVSVLPSSDVVEQMLADGITNIFITNNNGVLTATAIGATPTVPITLQVLCTESNISGDIAELPSIVGSGIIETVEADNLTDAVNILGEDINELKNAIDQKQDAPSSAGTAGQVLGLDSNLDPVWVNQSGGGDVSNCAPIIINTASGDIASFADGADNRQIRKIVGTIVPAQSGTGDPSPDNVRPISGWTGANIMCGGVNILPQIENGYYPLFLPKGTKITASCDYITTNPRRVTYYRKDKTQIDYWGLDQYALNNTRSYHVITLNEDTYYFAFSNTVANVKIEFGSTPTPYSLPQFSTIPINWQDEAGTIYGGTVTLNEDGSCDVVADRMVVDIPNLNWSKYGSDQLYFRGFGYKIDTSKVVCDIYKTVVENFANPIDYAVGSSVSSSYNQMLFIHDSRYETIEAFKAGNANTQLIINAETPQSYHLDNIGQLYTYLGANNVWIDTGAITECNYPADTKLYIDGLTAPDEDMIANANIASGKYFVVNNQLYLSTAAIAAGASIVPGTNCTATNLAEALNALNT